MRSAGREQHFSQLAVTSDPVQAPQVLKSLDWQKFSVDVVEVAVHSDAEHDAITLFLETQVSPGVPPATEALCQPTVLPAVQHSRNAAVG